MGDALPDRSISPAVGCGAAELSHRGNPDPDHLPAPCAVSLAATLGLLQHLCGLSAPQYVPLAVSLYSRRAHLRPVLSVPDLSAECDGNYPDLVLPLRLRTVLPAPHAVRLFLLVLLFAE